MLTCVLGAQKNRLIEMVLLSTHNICFGREIRITMALIRLHLCCSHATKLGLGHVTQSVTYLATDESLTANPGVPSSIQARFHTFVEIDHLIISTVILFPSAESFKKGCCQ